MSEKPTWLNYPNRKISQKEYVEDNFDANKLGSDEQVLDVLGKMEFGRFSTNVLHRLGRRAVKQVVGVHFYIPEGATSIVWQGRGIGAGPSDESYAWQNEGHADDPLDKGNDAAFAASVSVGVDTRLHPGEESQTGVMVMGLPGQVADTYGRNNDNESSRLSWKQKVALLKGDNRPVAQAQAEATWNVLKKTGHTETPLHLVGASLSTAQVTEMGAELLKKGLNVKSMDLIEPVNILKRPLLREMVPAIIRAAMQYGAYLDANHRIYQEAKKKVGNGEMTFLGGMKKLFGATALYGFSLHGESLSPLLDSDVVDMANEKGTVINLVVGGKSEFKTEKHARRAKESLEAIGYKHVILKSYEEGVHGITVNATTFVDTIEDSVHAHDEAA